MRAGIARSAQEGLAGDGWGQGVRAARAWNRAAGQERAGRALFPPSRRKHVQSSSRGRGPEARGREQDAGRDAHCAPRSMRGGMDAFTGPGGSALTRAGLLCVRHNIQLFFFHY